MSSRRRRLFIDPGSISSGYALFVGNLLMMSGTCMSEQKDRGDVDALRRLSLILGRFGALGQEPIDEVHIEQLVTKTHHYTHWAVGAIGTLFAGRPDAPPVTADVPISSWQAWVGWEKLKDKPTKEEHIGLSHAFMQKQRAKVASVDELAAIGLGVYWIEKQLGLKKVK